MPIRDNQICQFGIRRLPFGATPRFQLSLLRQQPYRGWPVGRAVQRKGGKMKKKKSESDLPCICVALTYQRHRCRPVFDGKPTLSSIMYISVYKLT